MAAVRAVCCRVVCTTTELKMTLPPKVLAKPFTDAVVIPFLEAYNAKRPSEAPLLAKEVRRVEVDGVRFEPDALTQTASSILHSGTQRIVLVPATRREALVVDDDEEWASDEAEEDKWGHKLHRENLRILTPYLRRAGLWRIRLSAVSFEVLEIVGTKGGPPQPNEFSLKLTSDGQPPVCGALTRLSDQGAKYVKCLVNDLTKISRARDLSRADAEATNDSTLGERHLEQMTKVVGTLPRGRAEMQAEQQQKAAAAEAEQAAQREADLAAVEEQMNGLSLEEEMRKAEKKAAKRARQKALETTQDVALGEGDSDE